MVDLLCEVNDGSGLAKLNCGHPRAREKISKDVPAEIGSGRTSDDHERQEVLLARVRLAR